MFHKNVSKDGAVVEGEVGSCSHDIFFQVYANQLNI